MATADAKRNPRQGIRRVRDDDLIGQDHLHDIASPGQPSSTPPHPSELARRGLWIFPVDHPELAQCAGVGKDHNPAACTDRGKHPAIAWKEGATLAPENIAFLFSGNPRNVGIHCGKSGLLVVDEDAPGEFQRYADAHNFASPPTYTVQTAKGKHYYFRDTENGRLGPHEGAFTDYNINIRSGVGFVVGPGSVHATGTVYTENGVRAYADVPAWVVEAIDGPKQNNGEHRTEGNFHTFELPNIIKDGTRDETLFRFASSLRGQSINYATAKTFMRWAWEKCEQPPGKPFTLESAYAKLDQAYKYPPGRSEGYEKNGDGNGQDATRQLRVTAATDIQIKATRWLWEDDHAHWIAMGSLVGLSGREGVGKSTWCARLIAQVTKGELPGDLYGTPKGAIICTTEDDWNATLKPRLMAAGQTWTECSVSTP